MLEGERDESGCAADSGRVRADRRGTEKFQARGADFALAAGAGTGTGPCHPRRQDGQRGYRNPGHRRDGRRTNNRAPGPHGYGLREDPG